MNSRSSIACAAIAGLLLLASLMLSRGPALHSPFGVLVLFATGLFLSLGFALFGHIRFDELLGECSDEEVPGA